MKDYEAEGLRSLADHYSTLKRFHSTPTDVFHADRRAEMHSREIDQIGIDMGIRDDMPQWFA